MAVHFDLHKYRQKLFVWHQFDKINVEPQNDFIFLFFRSDLTISMRREQANVDVHTLRIPLLQEWQYWLCFVIIDYDRWQSPRTHLHWFKLKLMKSAQWFLRTRNRFFFFAPLLQTDLIAGVARCVLSQTSDKLKYFVVKLIYIDWKEK